MNLHSRTENLAQVFYWNGSMEDTSLRPDQQRHTCIPAITYKQLLADITVDTFAHVRIHSFAHKRMSEWMHEFVFALDYMRA